MTQSYTMLGKVRVLFSDLDRTLLRHDYTIHPRVPAAVKAAREAGLLIVFVSARAPASLLQVAGPLDVDGLAVCLNGAWIGDLRSGIAQVSCRLETELALRIFVDAHERSAQPIWYGTDRICVRELTPDVTWQLGKVGESATVATSLDQYREGPLKIMCIDRREATCFAELAARWSNEATLVQSHASLLEISPLQVSKGAAIRLVMEQLGLQRTECAAVGDAQNDISMLNAVDFPCAVANAIDEVKHKALYVGKSCDEGGVADVIEWLLKPVEGKADASAGRM